MKNMYTSDLDREICLPEASIDVRFFVVYGECSRSIELPLRLVHLVAEL